MYILIKDRAGGEELARLREAKPPLRPDTNRIPGFENLELEHVMPGGFTVATFDLHRPIRILYPELQSFNQVEIGESDEIIWDGFLDIPARSIKPDTFSNTCQGWASRLNDLGTTDDVFVGGGGYKLSTFMTDVALTDADLELIEGTIDTGDYDHLNGTRFEFKPLTSYYDAFDELNAATLWNWYVDIGKTLNLVEPSDEVSWLIKTSDCEDLKIQPNPEAYCNRLEVSYTQDGTHQQQFMIEDTDSQAEYGRVVTKELAIPGKIVTGSSVPPYTGAYKVAYEALADAAQLRVSAEVTVTAIYDAVGTPAPLWAVRGGDVVRITDWLPQEEVVEGGVDNLATYRLRSMKYIHNSKTLQLVPAEFVSQVDIWMARANMVGYWT